MNQKPVGIFDSGVGGLTVLSEILKALPNEEFIFFGDAARVPYGSKSVETVTKFSRQIVNFLVSKDVKAIVIACSTVSSNCFKTLSAEFPLPFIEVISPGVEDAALVTRNKTIGVIGTEATIGSGLYDALLKEKIPGAKVYSKACPLFVPLAEEGWTKNTVARITAEIYLQELLDKEIDSLILGCTHYPLLINCIKDVVGPVRIINAAESTARRLKSFLSSNHLENPSRSPTSPKFFVSDNTKKFDRISSLVLRQNFSASIIDIEKY
ncbi:MAG: glutamate racemase [Clostridiales bacterium]|jgi:glutamate racemase|nr:glutamate racemase [Clostridiales bacterium]